MIDTYRGLRVVPAKEDGRAHKLTFTTGGPKHTRLTACGRHPGADAPRDATRGDRLCGVCFPRDAHPMDVVWQQCERWDANANADIPTYQYAMEG